MTFALDTAWDVNPQVSIRPERFGALLYHFGTRRLSFLKDPALLRVLQELPASDDVRGACRAAGVADADLPTFVAALGTLAHSQMITPRATTGPRTTTGPRPTTGPRTTTGPHPTSQEDVA